ASRGVHARGCEGRRLIGILLRGLGGLARRFGGGLRLARRLLGIDAGHRMAPYAALFGWKFGCTTAPSLVSTVALTISSSQLTASALAFLSTRMSRKLYRFLAYRPDADAASRPAMLV